MPWITLLVYAIVTTLFLLVLKFGVENDGEWGPLITASMLWPVIVVGVVLYYAGKTFAYLASKACEFCARKDRPK